MDSQENSYANRSNFELSEFFEFDEWEEDPGMVVSEYPQNPVYAENDHVSYVGGSSSHHEGTSTKDPPSGQEKKEIKEKVAFKTKSEVEILDDGFKWRKYGKKMVKNSPNPRCSVEGCPVKKRVERDREDPRYVITTYEGVHTHQVPSRF